MLLLPFDVVGHIIIMGVVVVFVSFAVVVTVILAVVFLSFVVVSISPCTSLPFNPHGPCITTLQKCKAKTFPFHNIQTK